MKSFLSIFTVLAFAASPCLALMSIAFVTPERAKELGLEIHATPSGPDVVRVELVFAKQGALASFHRVDLDLYEEGKWTGKLLLSSTLHEGPAAEGKVSVSFAVARTLFNQCTLDIVTGDPGNFVGHVVSVRDFVDLEKVR